MSVWRCCVLVITATQLHSTIPGLGFKEGSNTASKMPEICDGKNLWQ